MFQPIDMLDKYTERHSRNRGVNYFEVWSQTNITNLIDLLLVDLSGLRRFLGAFIEGRASYQYFSLRFEVILTIPSTTFMSCVRRMIGRARLRA
jgi:hypothetical protein